MISHRLQESTALTISIKVHLTTMAEGESDSHDMHIKKSSMSNVITAIQTETSMKEESFRASDYISPSKLHILWIYVIRRCKDFISVCRQHRAITLITIFLACSVAVFMIISCAQICTLDSTYSYPVSVSNVSEPFKLIMFGDSLVTGNHAQNFGIFPQLASKVSFYLPNFNLNLMNFGHNADGIVALRRRMKHVLATPADAIIILWDSDINANVESKVDIAILREFYISNVTFVVNSIQKNSSTVLIALAGPIIIGEGVFFKKVPFTTYHKRIAMLNDYAAINRKIADNFNITYIDIRSTYLNALPLYRMSYQGCLTIDGEHENGNGMAIIAKSIAKVVAEWQNKLFW
jgi:lysophospholipase L1-like esterase